MSLPHAVLTSLLEKPSSGFELARRFDRSIGYFWHATHQQIYRELGRMEEAGWIASQPAADAGQTRKREYRVLPAGRAELVRWAREPSPPMDLRDALMVKLRVAARLQQVDLRAELAAHVAHHQAQLEHYRTIEARDFCAGKKASKAQQIQHLLLEKGILYEQHSLAWAEAMLALLQSP